MSAGRAAEGDDRASASRLRFARAFSGWADWLGALSFGAQRDPDYIILGFSVRAHPAALLVVVRATRLADLRTVVAFGKGADLYDALRNVSAAIRKQQWRLDRFSTDL